MALFWVHQWIALPVIVEEPVMGGNPESPDIQDANPAVQSKFCPGLYLFVFSN